MSNLFGRTKRATRDEPSTSIADPANQGKKRKRVEDESQAFNRVKETPVPTPKLPVIPSSASSRPTVVKPVQSSQPASAKSNQSFGLQTKAASSAAMSWKPPAKLDHPSTSRVSSAPRSHAAEDSRQAATFAPITTSPPVSRSTFRSSNMKTSSSGHLDPGRCNDYSHAYGESGNSGSEAGISDNGGDEVMVEHEESEAEDEDEVFKADFDRFLSDCREEDDAEEEEALTFEEGNDSEDEQVVIHDGENYDHEDLMEGESNADAEEEAVFEGENHAKEEEVMEGEGEAENKEVMEDEDDVKEEEEMAHEVNDQAEDEGVYEGEYYDAAEEEAVSESEDYAQGEDMEMEDDNAEAKEESHQSENENQQSEEENKVDDTRPTTSNVAASGWTEAPGGAESTVSDISSITHSRHVLRADGGRAYGIWISDGKSIPAQGALLPSQYQLYDDAETP
ncbi:hypothetical protein LQW54_011719 [Pestalotiopsis sp. IQ-011]